tara:strand:- start:1549 stop:2010 length:462 start_codon:yes stop_codon:yes gene_type:complete
MKLTANFSLEEMTKSSTALRLGIDNTPNDAQLSNLVALCESVLQPLRDHFDLPVTITSGFRCPELNTRIGGSPVSDHCRGCAADIEIAGVDNLVLAEFLTGMTFRQLILEYYSVGIQDSGWIHISYDIEDNKKQVLTATKVGGKTSYLAGLIA